MPAIVGTKTGNYKRVFAYPLYFTTGNLGVLAANAGTGTTNIIGYPSQLTVLAQIGFASTGPFQIQLTPSSLGGGLFQAPIPSETLLGPLDRPGLLPIPILLIGNESIRIDLTNDNGAVANSVKLCFWGYREIPKPGNTLC